MAELTSEELRDMAAKLEGIAKRERTGNPLEDAALFVRVANSLRARAIHQQQRDRASGAAHSICSPVSAEDLPHLGPPIAFKLS